MLAVYRTCLSAVCWLCYVSVTFDKLQMEVTISGLTFTSQFNSGNLIRVEKVSAISDESGKEPAVSLSGKQTS